MKKAMALACLIFVVTLPMGCAKHEENTIRVADFLTDPVLIQILNDTLHKIEKDNPGLKIKLETTPYNDYQQKITTQMSANNAPDILFVEVNNFVDLFLRDVLEDLEPYVTRDQMDLTGYYPDVVHRFSPKGHLFAVPQDTAPSGLMYYNKKIFDEAGVPYPTDKWSWPEPFLSICQKLIKKDAAGKQVRWAYTEANPINIENFLLSAGGNWVDDTDHPTRFTVDSPEGMAAAQFRYDMINKYHVAPSISEMQSFNYGMGVEKMFMTGQIAMMTSGVWYTPQFLKDKDLDWDVVEFPRGPGGKQGWGSGGSGYSICKSSKNKDLAWKVIRAMTSEESLTALAATGMIQPALKKLAESDVFLKSPGAAHKSILLKMPEHSHYQPFMSNWGEIYYGTFNPAMDPVWLGNKTPAVVVPEVSKAINQKFFAGQK
jgi:multiple sugar transport system substrate-binding protein